jgi:hypothetical protein
VTTAEEEEEKGQQVVIGGLKSCVPVPGVEGDGWGMNAKGVCREFDALQRDWAAAAKKDGDWVLVFKTGKGLRVCVRTSM